MKNYLTQEDMVSVAETLVGGYEHVLGIYTQSQRDSASRFTAELVMRELPFMLVTPEGAARVQGMVFSHPENRDFIMTLTHVLFARLGGDDTFLEGLCNTLARGIAMPKKADHCLVPEDIRERLSTTEDVVLVLKDNLWLVTILLMQLFITIQTEEAKS